MNLFHRFSDRVAFAMEDATMQHWNGTLIEPEYRPQHRYPMREALLDVIARAEGSAGSDKDHFLNELRAVVAASETPTRRLRWRYRDWPCGPAKFYAEHRD